jgi:ribosomal protein S18 acetylase RimI-like enzyme
MSFLDNPVYAALCSGDAHLGRREGEVAWFDEAVSPFAGFPEGYERGFADLHNLLPAGRQMLYANPNPVQDFGGWELRAALAGTQFVFEGSVPPASETVKLVPLTPAHAAEMVQLAALTKPGPFDMRTIEFGHYYGVFDAGMLVAMTGQRLHVPGYSEISAVCTHPDHLGKGYAAALLQKQLELICGAGRTPFLHVRSDNDRAIALYERLGFRARSPMNFYFLRHAG